MIHYIAFLSLFIFTAASHAENINPKIFSFKTMNAPLGSDPVASSPTSTLNFTSNGGTVTITGNASTKTLNFESVSSGVAWGAITGTLSNQTDLASALALKAPLASPTFSGTITTPLTASRVLTTNGSSQLAASSVTATTLGFLDATSSIQTQLNAKQATLTPGTISTSTTGVSVGSGASSTVGPNVTVDVQTASGSQPGLLSAADWTTFNGKQAAGSYITSLTGDVTASGPGAAAASISASTVTGKALTGFSSGAGTVTAADTILTAFNKVWGWIVSLRTEEINGQIETVADKTYTLVAKARYASTIDKIYVACASGTTTLALKIGGTNITSCSAISVSSTPADTTCTAANSLAANAQLTMVTSSTSSCLDMIFTVQRTRN